MARQPTSSGSAGSLGHPRLTEFGRVHRSAPQTCGLPERSGHDATAVGAWSHRATLMSSSSPRSILGRTVGTIVLFAVLGGVAYALYTWKQRQMTASQAAAAAMPEPAEAVEAADVELRAYTPLSTAIGTVRSLRSITLRNELAGTVREVHLETGAVVDEGDVLVQLDIAVESAQLEALRAEARLAASMLGRMERAQQSQGASAADVDRARAERDMADAQVARLEAVVAQKRIRAPFRARVGLVDLHVGQYLQPGTTITTLQGIADAVHVDFSVPQEIARQLQAGASIDVILAGTVEPVPAVIQAVDAQVDASTRNAVVRAALSGIDPLPRPGSSVRVRIPIAAERMVPSVPVSALRRGPDGNAVYVLEADAEGRLRSRQRRVESGTTVGGDVLILAGLEPGERVATVGSFKLREGALVHVVGRDPSAAGDRRESGR
jgi:membrane fusion protein (multidrug efflux system)